MKKSFPRAPKHPERICWGCERFCPAERMSCGNGTERAMHPVEIFGEDWDSMDLILPLPQAKAAEEKGDA
ncbi:MAG: DUF3079 domain-containing protein [Rhodocyclaceae bacterium]|nr:DUF3079 domain-containing protein [Rhodocyclaceae bacterium]